MNLSIRNTCPREAEELSNIQKAAFKPLYETFRDAGSPYLRGPEDILRRLNKHNRHFTILLDGNIAGGIFYRLQGKRSPTDFLEAGEYYLARLYIHPAYQNKGIGKKAILLCEKEFPDAQAYYVDHPEVMEKNRRCYQGAGYRDTGERIAAADAPTLAMLKKTVTGPFDPAGVLLPVIYEVEEEELESCLEVIHHSFATVAEDFGLTPENCPRHTSFLPLAALKEQRQKGWHMYGLYAGKTIIGYASLSREGEGVFTLHNLSVLPEYRHRGFGRLLLAYADEAVRSMDGHAIQMGIIEESTQLKNWYMANGFVPTGTQKFPHLPFTVGYMEKRL